ncbi:MAG: CapA family protein [Chitinophagia bacterium]|nr:CapA family protein [Chitinophagia bacterium]
MTRTLYLVTALIAGWSFYNFYSYTDYATIGGKKIVNTPVPSDSLSNIILMGVGDIMLGSNYPSGDFLPPAGGKNLLKAVAPILSRADVSFGNLEGVIMSESGTPKQCKQPNYCYVFKSPDEYVQHFVDAGIDLLSVANNHTGDFGTKGRMHTAEVLSKAGIQFAGHETHPYTIFKRGTVTYGFCAFAPNAGTVSILQTEAAIAIIKKLQDSCDIVIVSMHAGAEGSRYNHITQKSEIFLGENRGNPYSFARMAIDAGADIVWGHGPHVVRAVDLYKNRFIAYSMGNFATYGTINTLGKTGFAPIIEIETDRTGNFIRGKIHSALQQKGRGPFWDSTYKAAKEIKRLTEIDFPKSALIVSEKGEIRQKNFK